MNKSYKWVKGNISTPQGFLCSGVSCNIKKDKSLDLALIMSSSIANACGVFTQNVVKGHSLQRTMNIIDKGLAKGIIINSGNANACVGDKGYQDAKDMAKAVANISNTSEDLILTGSTGVIGQPLPMDKINKGIIDAVNTLDNSQKSGENTQKAIMTTDTIPKGGNISINMSNNNINIAGIAKGSGMIHPNMATMIGIITTDCNITVPLMNKALKNVTEKSFNRVSVDGDTSVCDMVVMMSSCLGSNVLIDSENSNDYKTFTNALEDLCVYLAKKIAIDGEGATKLIEINALNLKTERDAYLVLQAVAKSPLVKTAMFGEDANWGRILTAAGYSGANFDPTKCDILIGDLSVCADGCAVDFDESIAKKILSKKEIFITIDFKSGNCSDKMWASDLSYEYIKINGSYRT